MPSLSLHFGGIIGNFGSQLEAQVYCKMDELQENRENFISFKLVYSEYNYKGQVFVKVCSTVDSTDNSVA